MNTRQIASFVNRYLDATACQVIERSPMATKAKLSPEADKALMNRNYYWTFVERTGEKPQTMTVTFRFGSQLEGDRQTGDRRNETVKTMENAALPAMGPRPREETMFYGCQLLEAIFRDVKAKGRYVHLFEKPPQPALRAAAGRPLPLHAYLNVNYLLSLECDMKRTELHSLGICLQTGNIIENFFNLMLPRKLTPMLPPRVHTLRAWTLSRAAGELEKYMERKIRSYDHGWAESAANRLREELDLVDDYYAKIMAQTANEEEKKEWASKAANRKSELKWQFAPRIHLSVINCGLFHLYDPPRPQTTTI